MSDQEYDNTDKGVLFKNERKTSERSPDYTGNANTDGVEYWLAGWINTSQAGKKYMSLAFTKKDEQPRKTETLPSTKPGATEPTPDDDIPF